MEEKRREEKRREGNTTLLTNRLYYYFQLAANLMKNPLNLITNRLLQNMNLKELV